MTSACGTSRVRSAASPSAVRPGARRRHEPLQQRDAEAERLAHAGAGLADQVVAGQRDRQGERLDGEGALDAGLGQRLHDLGAVAEFGEGGGSSLTGAPAWQRVRFGRPLRGIRWRSLGEISVESSVGTDRVIASLRALLPGPARRPPATWTPTGQESRQGAARTMSVAAPGDFRWPRQSALAARCGPSYPDGPAGVRSWSGESGHMIAPQPAAAPLDGRIARRRRATVAPQVI